MIGETVGQYRIVERLGEGGMGDVYLAEDLKLRRKAAVKIIAPHLTRDAARRQRFVQEALLAASIDHPHIAAIYDVDQVGDRTYIAVGAGRAAAEGRFDESIRLYETVVGRYPDTERAYTSLSFIYNPVFGAVPDANKELSILTRGVQRVPTSPGMQNLYGYAQLKDADAIIDEVRARIDSHRSAETAATAVLLQANIALDRGDCRTAARQGDAARTIGSQAPLWLARRWLVLADLLAGACEARSGSADRAQARLSRIKLDHLAAAPHERWWVQALEGEIALANGKPADAAAAFAAGEPSGIMPFARVGIGTPISIFSSRLVIRDGRARASRRSAATLRQSRSIGICSRQAGRPNGPRCSSLVTSSRSPGSSTRPDSATPPARNTGDSSTYGNRRRSAGGGRSPARSCRLTSRRSGKCRYHRRFMLDRFRLPRFVAAAALLLSAAACGGNTAAPTGSTSSFNPPPTTATSGLRVTDLVVGAGATAAVGNRVTVSYGGWLFDASQPESKGRQFDASTAYPFTLGVGQVIKGWDQGVPGMKVGGQRRLIIPPELGYGNQTVGPIPPNSTLVFDIRLLGVG
jgi:FKBP-type peptidyl-prolyl cis-trans isomerase FkpA